MSPDAALFLLGGFALFMTALVAGLLALVCSVPRGDARVDDQEVMTDQTDSRNSWCQRQGRERTAPGLFTPNNKRAR